MPSRGDKDLIYALGKRIRAARIAAGYTQQQFADMIGKSLRYVGNIESGAAGITITTLRDICKALAISSDMLLFGVGFKENDSTFFVEQLKNIDPDALPYLQDAMQAYIRFLGAHGYTFRE